MSPRQKLTLFDKKIVFRTNSKVLMQNSDLKIIHKNVCLFFFADYDEVMVLFVD